MWGHHRVDFEEKIYHNCLFYLFSVSMDGGIIPGSKLVPYTELFNEDQTIKQALELKTSKYMHILLLHT